MFKKKTCKKCGKKVSDKYEFCPHCGSRFSSTSEEGWGLLGKNDIIPEQQMPQPMLPGLSGKMINKMLGSAMKMLEKEMQKGAQNMQKDLNKMPRSKFRLSINGQEINLGNQPKPQQVKAELKKIKFPEKQFNEKQLKKLSKLPRKDAKTNIKRLSDKISYEIQLPGVNTMDKVMMRKLEENIEIKAISKTKVYVKVIPNLPLINYKLADEVLVLNFKSK